MNESVQPFAEINLGSFRMSPQADQLFTALSAAQGKFGAVTKDKTATVRSDKASYSYAYADLGSVLDAIRDAMMANGLSVLQPASTTGTKVTVCTVIAHKSGQWFAADLEMNATQNTPQGIGSAITYARRYGLSAMVGIASEMDDDGKTASEQPKPQQRSVPRQASKPEPTPLASEGNSPVSDMLARMKDKFSALKEFQNLKTEWMEMMGDEGEMRYYDILNKFGVSKSDQFKTLGESKRCAQHMAIELNEVRVNRPVSELVRHA